MKSGYDYRVNFEKALESKGIPGEWRAIAMHMRALFGDRVEVKTQDEAYKWGTWYIETGQDPERTGTYRDSGLYVSHPDAIWILITQDSGAVLPVAKLRKLEAFCAQAFANIEGDIPSKGFKLPFRACFSDGGVSAIARAGALEAEGQEMLRLWPSVVSLE